jgi:anti-sigma factor RsiW
MKQSLTDADLVAYLDGELSPSDRARVEQDLALDEGARARLRLLEAGGRRFGEAMESVLAEAPRLQLEAMLAGLPGYRKVPLRPGRPWPVVAALAAAVALFLMGMAADRLLPARGHRGSAPVAENEDAKDEWRQVVAEYLTLYTTETVASMPEGPEMREKELAGVGARLGVPLTPEQIALPDLTFRRAQLFDYDGSPLGQIAYLDRQSGPVALCIYDHGETDAAPHAERREGLNIVYWSRNGRSFLLIGHTNLSRLQNLADTLSTRLRS